MNLAPRARTAAECVYWMPTIAGKATNEWAANFAKSILKQSRRPGWQPSGKQLGTMRRLVGDFFTHDGADDMPVIERD